LTSRQPRYRRLTYTVGPSDISLHCTLRKPLESFSFRKGKRSTDFGSGNGWVTYVQEQNPYQPCVGNSWMTSDLFGMGVRHGGRKASTV
jgi:hypothetical protein